MINLNDLINVGIIIGGRSVESEISLISGSQAYLNIDNTKYNKTNSLSLKPFETVVFEI